VVLEHPGSDLPTWALFIPDGMSLVVSTMTGRILVRDLPAIERGLRDAGLAGGVEIDLWRTATEPAAFED